MAGCGRWAQSLRLVATTLALVAGCAGRAARVAEAPRVASCAAERAFDLLPSGAQEVGVADLVAVRRAPELAPLLVPFRPRDAEAFARTFGFRPEQATIVVHGSYESGELVLLDGEFDAEAIVEHVGSRMNTVEIVDTSPPRRVGFVGAARIDIAAVAPHRLAIGRGNGEPMMRLLGGCGARRSPRLVDEVTQEGVLLPVASPIVVVSDLRGRFGHETAAADVLSEVRWSVGAIEPRDGQVLARLHLVGRLPETAQENLRSIAREVADSELGGVFGIRRSIDALLIRSDTNGAVLELALPPGPFAEGVGIVFETEESRR